MDDNDGFVFVKFLAIILLVVGVMFTPIIGAAAYFDHAQCDQRSSLMRVDHEWGLVEGCMVRLDGQWQPFNDYVTVHVKR